MTIINIITTNMELKNEFINANEVFEYFYEVIKNTGKDFQDTKALFNVGFVIKDPTDNKITHRLRNWKLDYAIAEWQWYVSGDRSIKKLGNLYGMVPEIWYNMADDKGYVNSNYGYQWKRNKQLDYVIKELKTNPSSRKASISIYDAKEWHKYIKDTPCTYAVSFYIINNKLQMTVAMRSNDLWFGFCNDQYCFSMLQQMVAMELDLPVGEYYHFVNNFHLYNRNIK